MDEACKMACAALTRRRVNYQDLRGTGPHQQEGSDPDIADGVHVCKNDLECRS